MDKRITNVYLYNKTTIKTNTMKTQENYTRIERTVFDTATGREMPVTVDLQVKPLVHSGKVVKNMKGRVIMDDEWIYVGRKAINVNRANFCHKTYLSQVTIEQAVGSQKMTKALKSFCEKVTNKLIFVHGGTSYRVFLRRTGNGYYAIDSIKPYWATVYSGNGWGTVAKKYGGHPGWDFTEVNGNRVHKLEHKHLFVR